MVLHVRTARAGGERRSYPQREGTLCACASRVRVSVVCGRAGVHVGRVVLGRHNVAAQCVSRTNLFVQCDDSLGHMRLSMREYSPPPPSPLCYTRTHHSARPASHRYL